MKSFLNLSLLLGAAIFTDNAIAHPGHDHTAEVAQRAAYLAGHKRSLAHCADSLKARGIEAAMTKRRHAMAEDLRRKRSINHGKRRKLAQAVQCIVLQLLTYEF